MKTTPNDQRFSAAYRGEVIVASSREPEFAAARVLASRGIVGTMVSRSPGGLVDRMVLDIEKAANLTVAEGAKAGPRLGTYRPHPGHDAGDDPQ